MEKEVLELWNLCNYKTDPAADATRGHKSAHSLAIGPVTALPFISPFGLTITPALSSKWMKTPSFLLQAFLCLTTTAGVTFFLSSGFPFLTVAMIISPMAADGNRFWRPPTPVTEITNKFLAPVLSAQFITAATGKAKVVRNLFPLTPARPEKTKYCSSNYHEIGKRGNYSVNNTDRMNYTVL